MTESFLYQRCLSDNQRNAIDDAGLMDLVRHPNSETPRLDLAVKRSLGTSSAFLNFITFLRETGDLDSAAVINVGPNFKKHIKTKAELLPEGEKLHWGRELIDKDPQILKASGLDISYSHVLHAWHSVWTHSQQTYSAIGAVLDGHSRLQEKQQSALLTKLDPNFVAEPIRYGSDELESFSGFRPGRFSFWLGDDVLDNFDMIALHKSYAEKDSTNSEFIVFTVHANFFFICKKTDLLNWIQSPEGRAAFSNQNGDRLRIEGFQFPATTRDLQILRTLTGKPLNELLPELRQEIPEQVPADNIPKALAAKIESYLKANFPASAQRHLNWRTTEVITALS